MRYNDICFVAYEQLLNNQPARSPLDPRRIVAKLEKLLEKLDSCQKRLAKFPILLKRFRQGVLAAACSGAVHSAGPV